jgi:hypothetical protein
MVEVDGSNSSISIAAEEDRCCNLDGSLQSIAHCSLLFEHKPSTNPALSEGLPQHSISITPASVTHLFLHCRCHQLHL